MRENISISNEHLSQTTRRYAYKNTLNDDEREDPEGIKKNYKWEFNGLHEPHDGFVNSKQVSEREHLGNEMNECEEEEGRKYN